MYWGGQSPSLKLTQKYNWATFSISPQSMQNTNAKNGKHPTFKSDSALILTRLCRIGMKLVSSHQCRILIKLISSHRYRILFKLISSHRYRILFKLISSHLHRIAINLNYGSEGNRFSQFLHHPKFAFRRRPRKAPSTRILKKITSLKKPEN